MNKIFSQYLNRIALVVCVLIISNSEIRSQRITRDNFEFLTYPGFPDQNSLWDDIGYSTKYNTVYAIVTNHRDEQVLYGYDVTNRKMENLGFVDKLVGLRMYEWQGKVHTKITEGPDGEMYFGTDGGEDRQEYLMNHPHGYGGGYFMKWNPAEKKMKILTKGLQYESIKDVSVDKATGVVYGISYPQVHFMKFEASKNNFIDLGRLGSTHVPRVTFADKWGNIYYVDWRQRLVKYDKKEDKLIFDQNGLPMVPDQPGGVTVTGITAYAKDDANNIIYFTIYNGKLVAFHPKKEGIGNIVDLGGVVPEEYFDKGIEPWQAYTPNLAFGKNGKLYYFVGSEGRSAQKEKILFMEYTPQTGKKQIIQTFTTSEIRLSSGSNTTDVEGNMYFATQSKDTTTGKRTPYLVKFNPERKVTE